MYPGLVSCPFYAIPIYPFKFMKFFIYLWLRETTLVHGSLVLRPSSYVVLLYVCPLPIIFCKDVIIPSPPQRPGNEARYMVAS